MSIIYKKNHLAFLLAIAMFLLVIFGPKFALAQVTLASNGLDQSPITRGLCNVFEMASGNIGKAIAIFAIVAVGFGFFTGKFSIALVIGITLGIGILFGAPKIISALTGGEAVDCGTITSGEAEVCDGYLSFSGLTSMATVTNVLIITPFEEVASSNRKINFQSLFSVKCKTIANQKKWVLSDIVAPIPANSPISLSTFTSFGNDSQLTSTPPTASVPQTVTLTHQYICPKLSAKLFVASSGNCATVLVGSNKLAGSGGTSTSGTSGTSTDNMDICVAGNENTAKKVLAVGTPIANFSSEATSANAKNLVISKFGLVGHAATASVNGVTFTATCTAGVSGSPGYWNIVATGTSTSRVPLADIILN